MKTNLAVIFGGRSVEHDISVITAIGVMRFLNKKKYNIFPVYLRGGWYTGSGLFNIESYITFSPKNHTRITLDGGKFFTTRFGRQKEIFKPDAALLCTHGGEGENGCLQGLLEMQGIAYTSAGVTASAVTMDKIKMKELFVACGVDTLPFLKLFKEDENVLKASGDISGGAGGELPKTDGNNSKTDGVETPKTAGVDNTAKTIEKNNSKKSGKNAAKKSANKKGGESAENSAETAKTEKDDNISKIERELGYPVIIKPAHLGSSIGIGVAHDRKGLTEALNLAFTFDKYVLAERALTDFYEYNQAAGGGVLSAIERPLPKDEILSFTDKYVASTGRELPAQIAPELKEKISAATKKLYDFFDLAGIVRVDYLYDKAQKKLYPLEINTIPGSLSLYLFRAAGISEEEMLDKLISDALKRKKEDSELVTFFESGVLSSYKAKGTKYSKK